LELVWLDEDTDAKDTVPGGSGNGQTKTNTPSG
jgi:hypothetical protein